MIENVYQFFTSTVKLTSVSNFALNKLLVKDFYSLFGRLSVTIQCLEGVCGVIVMGMEEKKWGCLNLFSE